VDKKKRDQGLVVDDIFYYIIALNIPFAAL
jgi:hypothetical protein